MCGECVGKFTTKTDCSTAEPALFSPGHPVGRRLRMVEGRNAFDRERAPALAGRLERITVNLPAGFDPRRHTPAVIQKITESHGPGRSEERRVGNAKRSKVMMVNVEGKYRKQRRA